MEETEGEQNTLELVLLVALIDEALVELGVGPSQVGLQVLRVFIRHLDAGLQQRLRNDNDVHVLLGLSGSLTGEKGSELGVGNGIGLFQEAFESVDAIQPVLHQVQVL